MVEKIDVPKMERWRFHNIIQKYIEKFIFVMNGKTFKMIYLLLHISHCLVVFFYTNNIFVLMIQGNGWCHMKQRH